LTIRIPDDLRAVLKENVARRRKRRPKWNITEEVLGRLYWSYRKQEEERRDPYMKVLAYLISNVAKYVHVGRGLSSEWTRDPFLFRAFKHGVARVLNTLDPPGEAKPPLDIKGLRSEPENKIWQAMADQFESPEAAGNFAADHVLQELYRFAPEPEKWATLRELKYGGVADLMEEEFYAMSNVRRVLGIKEPKEPKS
jgi:hypothetical protein